MAGARAARPGWTSPGRLPRWGARASTTWWRCWPSRCRSISATPGCRTARSATESGDGPPPHRPARHPAAEDGGESRRSGARIFGGPAVSSAGPLCAEKGLDRSDWPRGARSPRAGLLCSAPPGRPAQAVSSPQVTGVEMTAPGAADAPAARGAVARVDRPEQPPAGGPGGERPAGDRAPARDAPPARPRRPAPSRGRCRRRGRRISRAPTGRSTPPSGSIPAARRRPSPRPRWTGCRGTIWARSPPACAPIPGSSTTPWSAISGSRTCSSGPSSSCW